MTCPHVVTSEDAPETSASAGPGEGETLTEHLDRVVGFLMIGAEGRWTKDLARQAIVQHVTSWYVDRQRADTGGAS